MRTKSDKKRQQILNIAEQVFNESGFEAASMGLISARVGGSKATLYNYFSSKEELFFEVIFRAIAAEFEATHDYLDPSKSEIADVLTTFGEGLLRSLYTPPSAIAVRRLIFAESRRSDLGRICYERGVQRSHRQLADFLDALMNQGKLRTADPAVAAWHLYGLLDAKLLRRCLLRVQETVSDDEIKTVVRQGVEVFMAAYGVSTAHPA